MILEQFISICKEINLIPYLTPYKKVNSKWTTDLKYKSPKQFQDMKEKKGRKKSCPISVPTPPISTPN